MKQPTTDEELSEDQDPDFGQRLRELVLFCADYDARNWKEIWWEWTYGETLEFCFELVRHKRKLQEELSEIENPMQLILTLLMERAR